MKAFSVPIDQKQAEGIKNAVERANVNSVVYWQQDFAFKLIKLKDLESSHWDMTEIQAKFNKWSRHIGT